MKMMNNILCLTGVGNCDMMSPEEEEAMIADPRS